MHAPIGQAAERCFECPLSPCCAHSRLTYIHHGWKCNIYVTPLFILSVCCDNEDVQCKLPWGRHLGCILLLAQIVKNGMLSLCCIPHTPSGGVQGVNLFHLCSDKADADMCSCPALGECGLYQRSASRILISADGTPKLCHMCILCCISLSEAGCVIYQLCLWCVCIVHWFQAGTACTTNFAEIEVV